MYMKYKDDINIFTKNEKQLKTFLQTIRYKGGIWHIEVRHAVSEEKKRKQKKQLKA